MTAEITSTPAQRGLVLPRLDNDRRWYERRASEARCSAERARYEAMRDALAAIIDDLTRMQVASGAPATASP